MIDEIIHDDKLMQNIMNDMALLYCHQCIAQEYFLREWEHVKCIGEKDFYTSHKKFVINYNINKIIYNLKIPEPGPLNIELYNDNTVACTCNYCTNIKSAPDTDKHLDSWFSSVIGN